MKNIYLQVLNKQLARSTLALATVTGAVGSTPQKRGSSALFDTDGLLAGTVGGGVVEDKVLHIIQKAIISKESGYYSFDLDKNISREDEAICGGKMSILIDAAPGLHHAVFEELRLSLRDGISGVLLTKVARQQDRQVSIVRYWIPEKGPGTTSDVSLMGIETKIKDLLAQGRSADYMELNLSGEEQDVMIFLEPVFPAPRLVIAGAGHIGKALAHLGNLLDFEVTVIDDRVEYANSTNIPDAVHLIVDDIGQAMQKLKITGGTYLVIVTRGHKSDADALRSCIGSGSAYIGMIGSEKKIALIREKSFKEGWATKKQWEQIHAPIGLPIHSKSVQEIAVSIAAQLVLVRNG